MRVNLKRRLLSIISMPIPILAIAPFLPLTLTSCSNENVCNGTMRAHIQEASEMTYHIRSSYTNIPDLWYSVDNGATWNQLIPTHEMGIEYDAKVSLPANTTVYFKGNNPEGWCKHDYDEATIRFSSPFSIAGNAMSLLDNGKGELRKIPNPFCFRYLFNAATRLIAVSNDFLPATELQLGCYQGLFKDCHNLVVTPALPATTCAPYCYQQMFLACESLTRIPKLPAMNLAECCYKEMFWSCVKLPSLAKENMLPAKVLAKGCYERMFQQCVSLGRLIIPTLLPATKLAERCYYGMFGDCQNLSVVPLLPATELASECYSFMFDDCDRLVDLSNSLHLNATTLAEGCYRDMFLDCEGLKVGPTIVDATTAPQCYEEMFMGCKSLEKIKVLFQNWNDGTTHDWVASSSEHTFPTSGTFQCLPNLEQKFGSDYIPNGWTVEIIE